MLIFEIVVEYSQSRMGMLQIVLIRLQIWLFILCTDGASSTYQTNKKSIPCVLNNFCDLPCRLDPYMKVNVLWFNGDNEMLSQGKEIRRNHKNLKIEKPAYNEWTLRIFKVKRNHEGTYHCRTNTGITLSEITVVIEHAPKIDEEKSSLIREYVQEMSVAQLNCIVTGIPEPEITWHRGQSEELIDGIKGHQLVIRNVERYASDDYTCVASNRLGTAKRHIRLVVTFAPEVTVMESEVYAAGGEEITLGCIVQASPLMDAYWTNNKGSMVKTSNWKYEVKVEKGSDIFPVRFLELRIKANIFSFHDQGNYTCHAIGEHQETHSSVTVSEVEGRDFKFS